VFIIKKLFLSDLLPIHLSHAGRDVAQVRLFETKKSQVAFVSDAPLELIKASSSQLKGYLDPSKRTFAFVIPSKSFEGFNSQLQQVHFYENYMEAAKYPEANFKGKIIEQVTFDTDGEMLVRAKGTLLIHGVEQERIIKLRIRIKKGILYVSSEFSILLQEYNITVPKVVNQKIAEEIFINVTMEMIRK
jgi:hypothetical protein